MKLLFKIFTLVCYFQFSSFADNLIKNGGFENDKNTPTNWQINGPVATLVPKTTIDNQIKFAGSFSLKMESSNNSIHGRAIQKVPILGGETYLFKANFLTKNVASIDKSVMIKITWYNGDENIGYHYIYNFSADKNGWVEATNKVKAVCQANFAEISLEFRWSNGTIWWDEISMGKTEPIAPRNIKIATVYNRPTGPTVAKNVADMEKLLDDAGKAGCQFICLPEGWPTCNTDIGMQKHEVNTLNGSASKMMAAKAKQYNMYIISGLYSWVGDTLNNVAALYNRQGNIQAVYKKVQLPDSEAEQGAVPGNTLPVFETDFGKIGILICWDYAFPEISRILALNGAEMLFCPIWGDIRGTDVWKITARSRAIDNGVFFITSIFDGHSLIVNPAGDVLQESGTQGTLLMANIDLNFHSGWTWLGGAGLGDWKGVWRKDRRADVFNSIGNFTSSKK